MSSTNVTPSWLNVFAGSPARYAWFVSALAALINGFGIAPDVFPGESAQLIAQHAGIDVFAPLTHIVWGWLGNLFSLLPFGTLGLKWNMLSAASGAAVCGLVVLLTSRLAVTSPKWKLHVMAPKAMSNLAGVTAGLLLALCLPFQIASSIAHPLTFELLMVLASVWLLVRYAETGSLTCGMASAFLFSLSLTQYATAMLIAPVYGCGLLWLLWRKKELRAKTLAAFASIFVVTIGLFFIVAAWRFSQQPGYHWAEMSGLGDVLYYMAQDLYRALKHGTPKLAAVLVTLFSLLPFLIVILLAGSRAPGSMILLLINLVIGVLLFLNIRFAPWPMFGFRPLLLMPYVIAAVWFGFLSSYLLGSMMSLLSVQLRFRKNQRAARFLPGIGFALLAGLLLSVGISSRSSSQINASMGITRYAASVADQAEPGAWLILDGDLEQLVRIKAHENNVTPFFISAQRLGHTPYQNALAEQLNDARLASMARMGLVPLVRERLLSEHQPAPAIAMIGNAVLLQFAAGSAWPDRTLYRFPESADRSLESYMDDQRAFWLTVTPDETGGPYHEVKRRLITQTARLANDAGVWLQDQQRNDFAAEAYREAMRLDANNLSAHLNLRALVSDDDPEAAALDEEIERLSAALRGRRSLVQITDLFGQIRHEASFRESDARWNPSHPADQLNEDLTMLFATASDDEVYRQLMEQAGTNQVTQLGLARLASGQGRPGVARAIIDRLPKQGPIGRAAAIENASLYMKEENREKAYQVLSAIPDEELDDPRALILLALLTIESNPLACDAYLEKLDAFPNLFISLRLPIAQIHAARGNRDTAAAILSQLVSLQPLNTDALQLLLRIQLDQGDTKAAMAPARQLLAINPRDPLANTALALHLFAQGHETEAAEAQRIALAIQPECAKYFENVSK
jgi:Flp pilus assembly protein TadD